MNSFSDVINAWPCPAAFAVDIGVPEDHARTMRRRNSIPPKYWARVVASAARRGIEGITGDLLIRLADEPEPDKRSREPAHQVA